MLPKKTCSLCYTRIILNHTHTLNDDPKYTDATIRCLLFIIFIIVYALKSFQGLVSIYVGAMVLIEKNSSPKIHNFTAGTSD